MAKQNDYLAKQNALMQTCFEAGCELATQQIFDMLCLVLNDPQIMGKNVYGAQRLKKIHDALTAREAIYHDAWTHTEESDYLQEKLDAALREIFGEIEPFNERYPYMKEWNYFKKSKKGKAKK